MTIANAKQFILRGMKDRSLRTRITVSSGRTELLNVLETEGYRFSADDFEAAFYNLLTQCQYDDQADPLKEFRTWWNLIEAMTPEDTKRTTDFPAT